MNNIDNHCEKEILDELTFAVTEKESGYHTYCLTIPGSIFKSDTFDGSLKLCEDMAGPILAVALKEGFPVSKELSYPDALDGQDFAEVTVPAIMGQDTCAVQKTIGTYPNNKK